MSRGNKLFDGESKDDKSQPLIDKNLEQIAEQIRAIERHLRLCNDKLNVFTDPHAANKKDLDKKLAVMMETLRDKSHHIRRHAREFTQSEEARLPENCVQFRREQTELSDDLEQYKKEIKKYEKDLITRLRASITRDEANLAELQEMLADSTPKKSVRKK